MSSNSMPDKEDRARAFQTVLREIQSAVTCLQGMKHPDDDPRKLERAIGFLDRAIGDYDDHEYVPSGDCLLEHYFS